MGISRQTLHDWERKYQDISDILKKGREVVVRELENSLIKRAKGFEYDEKTYERNKDGHLVLMRKVRKIVLPDTTALIFALKNMSPINWRDKKENMIGTTDQEENAGMMQLVQSLNEARKGRS